MKMPGAGENGSLGERLSALVLLLQVGDQYVAVVAQVRLVPGKDDIRQLLVEAVHVELGERGIIDHELAEYPLPARVLVVVLTLAVIETMRR